MMLSSELSLKACQTVEEMGDAFQRRGRQDRIETSLFRRLLAPGHSLLQGAVDEVAAEEE